ncbi:MAG: 4-hydroxybutyryl-CoA dehydratase [Betaproteobacteria bacterium]|nr:4-hydroxybutyryl-CoA dehydratase [Betaproteobacteria bacterium]
MMNAAQYRDSLAKRKPMKIWLDGQMLAKPLDHPYVKTSMNSVALTYELAQDPQFRQVMTATSALTGETISRFCHLHQSTDDLINKVRMQRLLGQRCGTCFQRCVGLDALNAVFATTFEMDRKLGTDYHRRFRNFAVAMERNDWIVDGAMTDVKGDRSKRPGAQKDKDIYLRVVERRADGVIIRGAKAHQTGAINSHQVLVMPTSSLREDEKDYAITCALPSDAEGITYIYGRQSCDERKLGGDEASDIDSGSSCYGGQEALMIFEHVFVPDEMIFMNGETEFAGMLVDLFASYHRQSYGGCKVGNGDVAIGAAAAIAEYNGVAKASHVKDKIVEMNHLNETLFSCGIACSANGTKLPAGNFFVDALLANVCKQNVTRLPYEIARILQDIAGGLMVTLPSARDWLNPQTGELLKKYLAGADGMSTYERVRMLRLIENLTMGRGAVAYLSESMHGAGSPQAQRVLIGRLAKVEEKKVYARALAFNNNLESVEAAIRAVLEKVRAAG